MTMVSTPAASFHFDSCKKAIFNQAIHDAPR
jgi:hypothetical protein